MPKSIKPTTKSSIKSKSTSNKSSISKSTSTKSSSKTSKISSESSKPTSRRNKCQTNQFTLYTGDYFKEFNKLKRAGNSEEQIIKKLKTKKYKLNMPLWAIRMESDMREKAVVSSFKPIPISNVETMDAMSKYKQELNVAHESDFWKYADWRWKDFCVDALKTLTDLLTVGSIKYGYKLELGRINFAIIDRMFSSCQCVKEVVEKKGVLGYDEYKYNEYRYKFMKDSGFPSMATDHEWWIQHFFPSKSSKPLQKSVFVCLTFVVNDRDNRVFCNWEMQTFTMKLSKHEDKRLGSGHWLLTI